MLTRRRFPSLASCSKLLDVAHSNCSLLLRRLVCTRRACCLFAHAVALLLLPTSIEPLPRGSRAVAFPRWLHVLSCSTWLMVSCCIDSCVFASLELIVIVVIVCVTHRLTLSSSLSPLHASSMRHRCCPSSSTALRLSYRRFI